MTKLIPIWTAIMVVCMLGFSGPDKSPAGAKEPVKTVEVDRDFDEALHNKCLYPTIRISSADISQKSSGFIVRSEKSADDNGDIVYHNVALTCAHCVSDFDTVYHADVAVYEGGTSFQNWNRFPGIVYAINPKLDLAIFVFTTPTKMATVELDLARKMCISNGVFHMGCGLGDQPRYDVGFITSLNSRVGGHDTPVYRTSMPTYFGDSGGPAFYKNNKVIGMMQAIRVTSFRGFPQMVPGISLCIPIGTFKTWDGLENNTLRFIYNPEADLPRLPFAALKFQHLDWENIEHEGE